MYCYNCKNPYTIISCNGRVQYRCDYSNNFYCWQDTIITNDNNNIYYYGVDVRYNDVLYRIHAWNNEAKSCTQISSFHLRNKFFKLNCFITLPLSIDELSYSPNILINKIFKLLNII